MRKDMSKKLCERPRFGGDSYYGNRLDRQAARDELKMGNLPKRESMKIRHIRDYNGKQQDEYFPPLLRFLKKNIGRSWDKIFSEISENLSPRSATGKHVFDHLLNDFVLVSPMYVEGSKYPHVPGWRGTREYAGLYVDSNGILRNNDRPRDKARRARKRARSSTKTVRISDTESYCFISGFWYLLTYTLLKRGDEDAVFDIVKHTDVRYSSYGGDLIFVGDNLRKRVPTKKRQISKKEVIREGLDKL